MSTNSLKSKAQDQLQKAWVYDLERDLEALAVARANFQNRNEAGYKQKPMPDRPAKVDISDIIEVFYNPKTQQKTEPDNYYWTKSGEITKKGPSNFVGEAGITETGSGARMTVSHPDRGELRPVPMAMVSRAALEKAGGILTDEVFATDLRSQGYVYRAAPPPEPTADLSQRTRTSPAELMLEIQAARAAAIATQAPPVMPTQAAPVESPSFDAMREALAKIGVKIPAANAPAQPAGVLTETYRVAAAPSTPSLQAPSQTLEQQGVLAQPGKPLTENYAAAVRAMNAIGQEKITPDQIKDVIQSFRAAYLDKFADALDKINKGETSFLKTGDVLHAANREYRSGTQTQAPRRDDHSHTVQEAMKGLPDAQRQTQERIEQAQAQMQQSQANLGYLMASTETQKGIDTIYRKVAEEFKIDPSKLPPAVIKQINSEVDRIMRPEYPEIEKILAEQGEKAGREALLKAHEQALRKVVQETFPQKRGDLSPTNMDQPSPVFAEVQVNYASAPQGGGARPIALKI